MNIPFSEKSVSVLLIFAGLKSIITVPADPQSINER